jgi:hypothetical protein
MGSRIACLALALSACGGAQSGGNAAEPPRALDEARAMELAAEVFAEYGVQGEAHREVHLGTVDFEVDLSVVDKPVGIELVTDFDRPTLGPVLRGGGRSGGLRVIAVDERRRRRRTDVLFLDDRGYRYDPNPLETAGGATTIQEIEGRFRRDLRDFLEHERTAGQL